MVEVLTAPPPPLLVALAGGCCQVLEADARDQVAAFLTGQRTADGGYRGRSTGSDLYYALFAVDGLAALGRPWDDPDLRAFVAAFGDGDGLDLVHLTCLARLRSRLGDDLGRLAGILTRLEHHRGPGGAFRANGHRHGSAYATFLAQLTGDETGHELVGADVSAALEALRAEDGGFAERPGLACGTTTVTAAAALLLARTGHADEALADWLLAVGSETGFAASPVTPLPDLLSTASALLALATLGRPLSGLAAGCLELVDDLWRDDGGFAGHPLDETSDAEYTFYALLTLGLAGAAWT